MFSLGNVTRERGIEGGDFLEADLRGHTRPGRLSVSLSATEPVSWRGEFCRHWRRAPSKGNENSFLFVWA
jgi:hypothetical protein